MKLEPLTGLLIAGCLSTPARPECPAFAEMCDDFETGDLSKWSGQILSSGPTPSGQFVRGETVVDMTKVYDGSFALNATMPPMMNGAAASVCQQLSPRSTGMLAVRFWVYAQKAPVHGEGILLISGQTTCERTTGQRYVQIGCAADGKWRVSEGWPGVDGRFNLGEPCFQDATWTCVELNYTLDAPRRMEIFASEIGAKEVKVLDSVPQDPDPTFSAVEVGVTRATANGYQVFVDNVVIAHQHIGCQ